MRFFRTGILILVVLLAGAAVGFAQTATDNHNVEVTIGNVFTLEVEASGTAVALSTSAPPAGSAGSAVVGDTGSKDLYYTVLSSVATNTITAEIGADIVEATTGYRLTVAAAVPSGATHGVGSAAQTLSNTTPVTIISAIPSVATTRTNGTCPLLTYSLVIVNSADLDPAVAVDTHVVTLTLSQIP